MSWTSKAEEAAAYWKDKPSKIWKCKVNSHEKYVRARDEEKAKASALTNSFHKRPRVYSCVLAHPVYDLGGVPSGNQQQDI